MIKGVILFVGILSTYLMWFFGQVFVTDRRHLALIDIAAVVAAVLMIWTAVFER